ncbi:MAG: hypothetical protein ACK45B_05240 [Limisphaerales bacterium]
MTTRPKRIKGISMSGVRLLERIATGRGRPNRQRRLAGKNFIHWRRAVE